MRPSRSSSIVPLRSPQLVENEGAGIPDVWEICGVPGGCSRARTSPEAHRVRSRARSSPGALKIRSRARSSQVMALCSKLVASSSVGTARAPLSTSVSRPCASTWAWPTILPPDLPPTHPLPRHFLVLVCGASGICSLKVGLCHGPAGVPWPAIRCLFVCLSTWLVLCCWCHVLSCILSDLALLVISLLFQLRHLCPPRSSPHFFSWSLQSYAVSLSNVRCYVVYVLSLPACLFFPLGVFLFHVIIKRPCSPAIESSPLLT